MARSDQQPSFPPSVSVAEQAADWVLSLDETSPDQYAQKQAEYEAWKQADPRHAAAAAKVEGFVGQINQVSGRNASSSQRAIKALDASLQHAAKRKRKLVAKTLLTLLFIVSVPAAILLQRYPVSHLTADKVAAAGEWQEHRLPDGTSITLAGKSAIDVNFTAQQRNITLLSGEIYVDVAADANRPFVVTTDNGRIKALGTRFVVNQGPLTRLSMFESKVLASRLPDEKGKPAASRVIRAGEQISISAQGLSAVKPIDPALMEANWKRHQLMVSGWRLDQVLAELNRYHTGHIHFAAQELKHIQVSAVLPLDNPDAALQLLAANIGLNIRNISPWLIIVDTKK